MRLLTRGSQTSERVDLLMAFTRIESEFTVAAVKAHLVQGLRVARAASIHGMTHSNLNRVLDTLESVATHVERIKAHDFKTYNTAITNRISE